jgi:hypothetical protein
MNPKPVPLIAAHARSVNVLHLGAIERFAAQPGMPQQDEARGEHDAAVRACWQQ